jgi:hypothetical protein
LILRKQPNIDVKKKPVAMKPEEIIDNKKPPIIPKNIPIPPPPLPEPLTRKELENEHALYPEDVYNINNAQKRKPTIIECNDPVIPDTNSPVIFPPPPIGFKTQITSKPTQGSPLEKKWKENLVTNVQNERPKLKPVEVKNKPPPASALVNKPTNAEIKQSFIEKFIKPLDAADASNTVSVPSM